MKRALLLILGLSVGTLLFACGSEPDAEAQTQLRDYIMAQEALAADDFANAQKALKSLVQHSDESLKSLAVRAADATDIQTMRDGFGPLSERFMDREIPPGYKLAYCPMADHNQGAYWVQKEGEIMNPYFGSAMLHCGVFKDKP